MTIAAKTIAAKTIAAKNSLGVFAQCPRCHSSIQHGFQVCGSCGYTVSALQQQALRNLLKKNVARHFLVFLVLMGASLWAIHRLFG